MSAVARIGREDARPVAGIAPVTARRPLINRTKDDLREIARFRDLVIRYMRPGLREPGQPAQRIPRVIPDQRSHAFGVTRESARFHIHQPRNLA